MKWLTKTTGNVNGITSELQDIVHEFRPELAAILDTRSPFYLIRSLMELIVNECRRNGDRQKKLEGENETLETALNNCHKAYRELEIRAREWAVDIAWRKVAERDQVIKDLADEVQNLGDDNANLQLQINEAYREQEILRKNIVEMNHLIARQHQQLLGLLGTDFERP